MPLFSSQVVALNGRDGRVRTGVEEQLGRRRGFYDQIDQLLEQLGLRRDHADPCANYDRLHWRRLEQTNELLLELFGLVDWDESEIDASSFSVAYCLIDASIEIIWLDLCECYAES